MAKTFTGTMLRPSVGQNVEVTQANFTEFRRRVVDGGEKSNGVGPSQVT